MKYSKPSSILQGLYMCGHTTRSPAENLEPETCQEKKQLEVRLRYLRVQHRLEWTYGCALPVEDIRRWNNVGHGSNNT